MVCYNKDKSHCPDLLAAEKQCRNYPHVAVKIISMNHLQGLMPILDMVENVKIIMLMRDPRGVLSSRKNRVSTPLNGKVKTMFIKRNAHLFCNTAYSDIVYAVNWTKQQPEVDSHRPEVGSPFVVLRYEDLASDPVHTVRSVYERVNIAADESVLKWAEEMQERNENNTRMHLGR